jgi:hypothetical protein
MEQNKIYFQESGAQIPGSVRVVIANLSLLLIIHLIGILIISLILLIG